MTTCLGDLCNNVKNHYIPLAPVNTRFGANHCTRPIGRFVFLFGSLQAVVLATVDAVKIVFFTLANIFTLFKNPEYKDSLKQSISALLAHSIANPVGFLGFLFPMTINSCIGLPPEGTSIPPSHPMHGIHPISV